MSHFFKKRTTTTPTITRTHSRRSTGSKVPSLDLQATQEPVFTKKENAPELLFNLLNSSTEEITRPATPREKGKQIKDKAKKIIKKKHTKLKSHFDEELQSAPQELGRDTNSTSPRTGLSDLPTSDIQEKELVSEPVTLSECKTPRDRSNSSVPMRMAARATPSYQFISDIENELDRKQFENEMERLLTEYEGEVHPSQLKSARLYQSEKSTLPTITRLDSAGFNFSILNNDSGPLAPNFSAPISEGTLEDFRDEMEKQLSSPMPITEKHEIFWIDDVKYEKCQKWLFRPLESLPATGTFVQKHHNLTTKFKFDYMQTKSRK